MQNDGVLADETHNSLSYWEDMFGNIQNFSPNSNDNKLQPALFLMK